MSFHRCWTHMAHPHIRRLLAAMTCLLLLGAGCRPVAETKTAAQDAGLVEPREKPRVLLVQSYHAGYEWTDSITRGVRMTLHPSDATVEVFYMDTKRHPDEDWKQKIGAEAKRIVSEWNPAVVIAADDNAQAYFAKEYAGDAHVPVVFCGVNNEPADYGYPAPNITGILERPHFKQSLELLRRISPTASRIAIVTDDSETSRGALNFMTDVPEGMTIVSRKCPTFMDEWEAAIRECQTQADVIAIYTYHTVKARGQTTSLPAKEVMEWTLNHSQRPVLGFLVFVMDDGALCGYAESGVEQGQRAGEMAHRILQGEKPANIPMITALEGQSMVNLKTAQRLGLTVPDDVIQSTAMVIRE